ncbi:MAG TPA: GNAT family N-acetyltransferase [Candidatus Dormibacteraeota bacterium]|nr:GNAT family N-acetyltransferase [Candidatus Dormibacteraeota bacterium]
MLQLRPATLDDARLVADLETRAEPDDPHDADLLRHRWSMTDRFDFAMREIALEDGEAIAFVGARHEPWDSADVRFGTIRLTLRDDAWSKKEFTALVRDGEAWLRGEGAKTAIMRLREHSQKQLAAVKDLGYREVRRGRNSELDLVERRQHIEAALNQCRARMKSIGVRLMTLSDDDDPDKLDKLYRMLVEAEGDIPTSSSWRVLGFDEWRHFWFDNPGISEDRLWTAHEGDATVGMTAIEYPVERGVPYTAMTGTARSVRGRGIAKALKYEAMHQAIALGFTRVMTQNDADNAPILRINAEMGYRLVWQTIELHHRLPAK